MSVSSEDRKEIQALLKRCEGSYPPDGSDFRDLLSLIDSLMLRIEHLENKMSRIFEAFKTLN